MPTLSVMAIGGISGNASNPDAALVQQQASTVSSLFGGSSTDDLSSLVASGAAYSLYDKPGLLAGLTQWDGGTTPASQRDPATAAAAQGSDGVALQWSFDPFNQKTWDVKPPAPANSSAPAADPTGTVTGTGVVVAQPQYSFNPFDQSTWDPSSWTGTTVDTQA